MTVQVRIPAIMRSCTGGVAEAGTLRGVIAGRHTSAQDLDTEVPAEAWVPVIPAVAGGAAETATDKGQMA